MFTLDTAVYPMSTPLNMGGGGGKRGYGQLNLSLEIIICCCVCILAYLHTEFTRLAPTWQYFGTIICDRLHGIMKLYIDQP